MRRVLIMIVLLCALAASVRAQIAVIDPVNLEQAILIADRTLREYETLVTQYQTIQRMRQALTNLDRYRMPVIGTARHDVGRWLYGQAWLQGLNTGDPRGTLYWQDTRDLQRPGNALDRLPPTARRAIEQAYATIEITDSIAQLGGHQVALVRGYTDQLQQAVQVLEEDVLGYHEMTQNLDKIAAGALLSRRQETAGNQLLSNVLEQLLIRSKRMRDTEAATMNMRLNSLVTGAATQDRLIQGAGDDLRTWRQP